MLKVFETFSGIGSQAKALKNAGIDHEILATADWDIAAIIAYDLIHHGSPNLDEVDAMSIDDIDSALSGYTFSITGKAPASARLIKQLPETLKRRLYAAVKRSKNLVSITDVHGTDLPSDIDLLTYSFPCQDLSLCKFWHGNAHGIDRSAHTRSGMLWEVERILLEMREANLVLPRFLLMENVCAIFNSLNRQNFSEWTALLQEFGYTNIEYTLNARYFGVPQNRPRAYMISVRTDHVAEREQYVQNYFQWDHKLDRSEYTLQARRRALTLADILRLDYSDPIIRAEADESQPNNTVSRQAIYETNAHLLDASGNPRTDLVVNTITTKQDRHPNSGVIDYSSRANGACYRNLTPRECFMLMGFSETDYEILARNNVPLNNTHMLFSRDKLLKMAGNSIVVDVLELIFREIDAVNRHLWPS